MYRKKGEQEFFIIASIVAAAIDRHLCSGKTASEFLKPLTEMEEETSYSDLCEALINFSLTGSKNNDFSRFITEALLEENRSERYRRAFAEGMYCLVPGQKHYSNLLLEIPAPPAVLFVKGELMRECTSWDRSCITVVGTRKPSEYGLRVAQVLGTEIAAKQGIVVSGLAYGIDSAAQKAALKNGGVSIAVLASPLDQVYPRMHIGLFDEICKQGCAISEHPPGSALYRQYFPARNRIMSGMSQVTVVVESSQRSGTQITIEQALAQGRDVWAVPGPIFSPQSKGVNALIFAGAAMLFDVRDFIRTMCDEGILRHKQIDLMNPSPTAANLSKTADLDPAFRTLLAELSSSPASAEKLADRLQWPIRKVFSILAELDLKDVVRFSGGEYILTGHVL